MQVGGGITDANASEFLEAGASAVIVTSFVFRDGRIDYDCLNRLEQAVGKEHLVLDLSCRYRADAEEPGYYIVTDRWQKFTTERVTNELLEKLSSRCSEFLVHAVDVEGKSGGIEKPLAQFLGDWGKIPITYAGGVHSFEDLEEVTGAMSLQEGSYVNNVVQPVQFPKLVKVGSFTYGGVLKTLSLPALQEVTGVCSIGTCFTNGVPAMLESINLPALKRVGTLKLTIGGATGSNPNTVITNLDCFENLESAESVYIEKQMGLISYKGLAKVIAGLNDAEAWEVIGNAFNPTFEEVKAGKLEKEE